MSEFQKQRVKEVLDEFEELYIDPIQAKDLLMLRTIMKLITIMLDQLNDIEEKIERKEK